MAGKIPVAVVSGFLGSGKTTLLNRYLRGQAGDASSTMVLINEIGAAGLDHRRVRRLGDRVAVLESGCQCCAVQGELVDALRELFLQALRKAIPPFSRLIIETTGIADPAPVRYTLQYERFLHERYAYAGCLVVVDAVHGARHLRERREAVQQAVLADALFLSKTDLAGEGDADALKSTLAGLNPAAPLYSSSGGQALAGMFDPAGAAERRRSGRAGSGLRFGAGFAARKREGAGEELGVLALEWRSPQSRAATTKALEAAMAYAGADMLRVKGSFRFSGAAGRWAVHGVHRVLYPIEPEAAAVGGNLVDDGGCALALIYRRVAAGADEALAEILRRHLPGVVA